MLIPATVLTGFLGAGKTTLLKRVLSESHGLKIAIIENEFGEENIDNDILVSDTKEHIVQMSNGCVCCTIREDLRTTLQELAEKKRKGELDFDRVVIETTGLADPGPVAQTFFMDDEIAESFLLDSVLTLVDAKHAAQTLNDRQEARRQIGFADQIFISKSELVSKDELEALQHRLKHMNPRAPQHIVHFGEIGIDKVFDLRGFNLNTTLEIDPDFLNEGHDHHQHDAEHCDHPSHAHDHHGDHPSRIHPGLQKMTLLHQNFREHHGSHCGNRRVLQAPLRPFWQGPFFARDEKETTRDDGHHGQADDHANCPKISAFKQHHLLSPACGF